MKEEIVIDDKNFSQYFRDIKTSLPTKDDEIVAFRCLAYFCRGELKQQILDFLCYEFNSVRKCIGKLIKNAGTTKTEAIKLLHMMCYDMIYTLNPKDVFEKDYPFIFEKIYYAKKEYIPLDDKRWQILKKNQK